MQRWLLTIFWICAPALVPAYGQVPVEAVRRFVQTELGHIEGASRIEVAVGEPSSKLRLAPCTRAEPFLRGSSRLWGRSFVGVRCMAGAEWSIDVPVQVHVYGNGLIAVRALPAGQPIGPADVRSEEVDWTQESQGVASDFAQIEGRVPTRTIEPGRVIALATLREPAAVSQGDPVKVIAVGQGFSIATEAVALATAPTGQPVRVRMESGKVLTGTARTGRVVEVQF